MCEELSGQRSAALASVSRVDGEKAELRGELSLKDDKLSAALEKQSGLSEVSSVCEDLRGKLSAALASVSRVEGEKAERGADTCLTAATLSEAWT